MLQEIRLVISQANQRSIMSKREVFIIKQGILGSCIGSSGPITITKNQVIRLNKKNSTFTKSMLTKKLNK